LYLKSFCVLQDHYDDERDKIRTSQDQTTAHKTKTKTDFWHQTGLVPRPTVSDHITAIHSNLVPLPPYPWLQVSGTLNTAL